MIMITYRPAVTTDQLFYSGNHFTDASLHSSTYKCKYFMFCCTLKAYCKAQFSIIPALRSSREYSEQYIQKEYAVLYG